MHFTIAEPVTGFKHAYLSNYCFCAVETYDTVSHKCGNTYIKFTVLLLFSLSRRRYSCASRLSIGSNSAQYYCALRCASKEAYVHQYRGDDDDINDSIHAYFFLNKVPWEYHILARMGWFDRSDITAAHNASPLLSLVVK